MVRRSYHVARASRLGESLELGDGQRRGAVFRLERRDALLPGLDSTDRRKRPHACSIERKKEEKKTTVSGGNYSGNKNKTAIPSTITSIL